MATSPNSTQITPPRVPIIDDRTGAVAREWYRWFYSLYNITGAGAGIIPVASGGTGLNTIPANGQLLIGNGTEYALNTLGTGSGISVTNGAGTISIANTGVLSNLAGTGISVSSATGNVTISNTGVLSFAGGTTGLTPATATTGAITLAGTLAIANGGTNGFSTPTAGAVPYGTGTAYAFTAAGTVGQVLTSNGAGVPTWTTPSTSSGTVTSVGQTFTGGIISVAGSPITTSGTLALTVAGTSGGIPYFSSSSAWASSAALTQYGVVYGGGAGVAPVATAAGTTGQVLTATTGAAPSWAAPATNGTVTSVGLSAPAIFTVTGSPVTTSGTLTLTYSGTALPTTSGGTGLTSFTANGIPYASSTSALATSSALTFNGTNLTTTGSTTAARFIPTSATAPSLGIWAPSVAALGFSAGGVNIARMTGNGLAIGSSLTPSAALIEVNSNSISTGFNANLTYNAAGFYNSGGLISSGNFSATQVNANSLRANTLQFDDGIDSGTVTTAVTLYIEGAPTGVSLTTITSPYALYIASGGSYFGGAVTLNTTSTHNGTATFANTTGNKLVVSGNISQAAWTTTGPAISVAAGTYTSTGALTGTVAASSLGQPTFTAASGTVTNAATLYIANAPATSGTPAITNALALYVAAGKTSLTGNLLLNTTATYPSVAATTAITPQFQLSGTTLSTASAAQFGWNTNPYYTLNKSLGAAGVYTAVTSGTALGILQFNGADGTNFTGAATITSSADGTVSLGVVPGRLVFSTADSGGTLTERLRITSAGGISFGSSGTAYGTTGQLLTSAGNAAPTWTSVTGSGNIVSATSPTITNLTLAAGTTALAPLVMTSGTSLTTPVAGAVEFDGTSFFTTINTTNERGFTPSVQYFRLTADGSAITTLANFFGGTSGVNLVASAFYEVEAYLYFTKTGAGTVTFTTTFSNAPINNNINLFGSPVAGPNIGAAQSAALIKSTATGGAITTASLTTAVNHVYVLRSMFQASASAGTFNISLTSSATSATPLTGSYYKITRLPAANVGKFV